MPHANVNGVRIFHELAGSGDVPVVLVHGSWISHHDWDPVAPALARRFRVLAYDRRGHSASGRHEGQGGVRGEVDDLAALIERLGLAPAWVLATSSGGSIALRLAGERPELLRGVIAHEPPLIGLLADDPTFAPLLREVGERVGAVLERIAAGDHAGAAEQFIETALGPGAWAQLLPETRQILIGNAPAFLDEARDPELTSIDPGCLAPFTGPVLLTRGDRSPPMYAPVVDRLAAALPRAQVWTYTGAGHVPHLSDPAAYLQATVGFIRAHEPGLA